MRNALVFALFFLGALLWVPTTNAQHTPTIFDVSDVVAGAQRLPTKYLYAITAVQIKAQITAAILKTRG